MVAVVGGMWSVRSVVLPGFTQRSIGEALARDIALCNISEIRRAMMNCNTWKDYVSFVRTGVLRTAKGRK